MSSLNSFDFTGRLGKEPELKSLPSGHDVCSFSVAVDTFGDKPPVWVDVSVWGQAAAPCAQYLGKGSQVAIHGKIDAVDGYIRKDGEAAAALRVSTRDVAFIGSKQDAQGVQTAVPVNDTPQPVGVAADDDIPF